MITAISCAAQQVLFNLHTIVMQDLAQNSDFLKKTAFILSISWAENAPSQQK